MANNEIIQVPPNYIVKEYKAVTRYAKRAGIKTGVSYVPQDGIDYTGTTVVLTSFVKGVHNNADSVFTFSVKGSTLVQCIDNDTPFVITVPASDYGQTSNWVTVTQGYFTNDGYHTDTTFSGVIDATKRAFFNAAPDTLFTFEVRIYLNEQPYFVWVVDKPFYPFKYEVLSMGNDDAVVYVSPSAPTWIDIDINSLFMNPRNIPCNEGEKTYLLHRNK